MAVTLSGILKSTAMPPKRRTQVRRAAAAAGVAGNQKDAFNQWRRTMPSSPDKLPEQKGLDAGQSADGAPTVTLSESNACVPPPAMRAAPMQIDVPASQLVERGPTAHSLRVHSSQDCDVVVVQANVANISGRKVKLPKASHNSRPRALKST